MEIIILLGMAFVLCGTFAYIVWPMPKKPDPSIAAAKAISEALQPLKKEETPLYSSKRRRRRALGVSYSRVATASPTPAPATNDGSGFLTGLIVGELLSGASHHEYSSAPSSDTGNVSGGGGEFGGGGASGSWDSSSSDSGSSSSSSFDSGSSSSGSSD